jgi:SAM-dependent methyltransferase
LGRGFETINKIDYLSSNWLAFKINNDSFLKCVSLLEGPVIDLGCGTSQYKADILQIAQPYIGVDWENSFHDRSCVDITANLSEKLPLEDNYAGTVVSFQVMEHLSEPGFFLSECQRILRPGGLLLITVPFMWQVHEAPYDFFRFTRHGLEYLLKKNGFVETQIHETTGFWQMWVLKFNYHSLRFAQGAFKYFWIPVWWAGQALSPFLDKLDPDPQETASYRVLARKP